METLAFALSVTGPIFLTLLVGLALSKLGLLSDAFVDEASRLVYQVALPVLLFINIYGAEAALAEEMPLLLAGAAATLVSLPLAWFVARAVPRADRSVFIQGSYRGNIGIIGLAWAASAYGESGLAQAALAMAVITTIYNIAAVSLFAAYAEQGGVRWRKLAWQIISNPLIIAIVLALLARQVSLPIPAMLLQTGAYIAGITLPLALLCIGASLDLSEISRTSIAAVGSSLFKLLLVPLLMVGGGLIAGLGGQELGVLFLLGAAPTATVSFIMARALGGNSQLAANIVALSTVLSIVSASVGLAVLPAIDSAISR